MTTKELYERLSRIMRLENQATEPPLDFEPSDAEEVMHIFLGCKEEGEDVLLDLAPIEVKVEDGSVWQVSVHDTDGTLLHSCRFAEYEKAEQFIDVLILLAELELEQQKPILS